MEKHVKIQIPYGRNGISFRIPRDNFFESLVMENRKPVESIDRAILDSLNNPIGSKRLQELSRGKKNACIIIFDITRHVPHRDILNPILGILRSNNIKRENIKLLVATGTHRPNTTEELIGMVSREIIENYTIINHNCMDEKINACVGHTGNGKEVRINRHFAEADLKILTGTIEPHLWAGFGGGVKGICPGVAHFDTIMMTHNPHVLSDPKTESGRIKGNKFYEKTVEIARLAKPDFMCNAVLNMDKKPIAFYSGDPIKAHLEGSNYCKKLTTLNYSDFADIVIVSGGGHPHDLTLYHTIKAMVQGHKIVKPGGTIIVCSKCSEGIGDEIFKRQLFEVDDINKYMENLLKSRDYKKDQWQLQDISRSLKRAKVLLYCDGIKDSQFPHHLITRLSSVEKGIEIAIERTGKRSKISIIRDGPYVIPKVSA